jgi:hypothetical protein
VNEMTARKALRNARVRLTEPTEPVAPNSAEQFLSEAELAARWRCARKTLRNHRSRNEGCPFVKLGSLVRYRLSDVVRCEIEGSRR